MELNFSTVTWPVLAIWGLALAAVVVGFLIGYFDSNSRSAKKIEAAESKAAVIRSEAERKIAEAEAIKAQAPAMMDDPGLLRLKNKNGMSTLEMDGVSLNIKNVSADQKKRLIELLSVIRPWLEAGQPVSPSAQATISTPPPPAPRAVPAQSAVPSFSPTPTQPLPVTTLTEKEFKALSIIAQIDYVFQTRIAGTPFESMGIRILEGAVGSVEVTIGASKYPSIDDVPDPEIKKAIRAAVTEWENKYTPGL
jgi:hypothetical protein